MTTEFTHNGINYWITVEKGFNIETGSEIGYAAYINTKQPGAILGMSLKDENGLIRFFRNSEEALEAAQNFVEISEKDEMQEYLNVSESEIERVLSHFLTVFENYDFLNVKWESNEQGLIIEHLKTGATLLLTYEAVAGFYFLYCHSADELIKYQSLCEITNYINISNHLNPDFAINLQLGTDKAVAVLRNV